MTATTAQIRIGYARCSTDGQDVEVQIDRLMALGVPRDRIYVDKGLTGTNRDRPALRTAMAACRPGDELVITKLDRLARSVRDASDISHELTQAGVKLNINGAVYDPTDPIGKLLFHTLAMMAEFEADLIKGRTREGMAKAKAKGRLKGKQPKLKAAQEARMVALYLEGEHTQAELAEEFGVSRATLGRAVDRAKAAAVVV